MWGFLAASLIFWLLERRFHRVISMIFSLFVCYFCGTLWYYFVWSDGGLWLILLKCVLPYLIPDGVKLGLALLCVRRLEKIA